MKLLKKGKEIIKPKYLVHQELPVIFKKGISLALSINFFILGFLFLTHEYPRNLATIDATFTFLTVVFLFVIFPLMINGVIPAYYMKHYYVMRKTNLVFMTGILSSVLRFPITYGILFFNIKYADTIQQSQHYKDVLMGYLINPIFNIFALILFSIYVYKLFFENKFATIKDFSIGMAVIHRKYNCFLTYKECLNKLEDRIQDDISQKMRFDKKDNKSNKIPVKNITEELEDNIPADNAEQYETLEELKQTINIDIGKIRRQSRIDNTKEESASVRRQSRI